MAYIFPFPGIDPKPDNPGKESVSACLIQWLVQEGDWVELNQDLAEFELGKMVVTLPSPVSGQIVKLHVHCGETVTVGQGLVTFEEKNLPSTAETGSPSWFTTGDWTSWPEDR